MKTACFIPIDANEVAEYANSIGFKVIERLLEFAQNIANGRGRLEK